MDKPKRIDAFWDNHFGLGIRWRSFHYQIEISIALPFFTVVFGFGKEV